MGYNIFAPTFCTRRRPAKRASYSASLLELLNSSRSAYVTSVPSGSVRIRPAPDPSALEAPSVYKDHGFSGALSASSVPFSSGISTKKSAITCPFNGPLVRKVMLNAPNSIAHFAIRPETSGRRRTCWIFWSVRTSIGWA
ncbi:hypothetical protein Hanom_Chr04g00352751 [Helianthus anomalus]